MSDEAQNRVFSEEEEETLAAVLDEIIPASDGGRLPAAGQIGVGRWVAEALQAMPDLRLMIAQGLSELEAQARRREAPRFAALSRQDRLQLLNQQGFVLPLTLHACAGYYQHPRVLAALGREARPPHPGGYEMEPNDLSLLDPVRRRGKIYRDV